MKREAKDCLHKMSPNTDKDRLLMLDWDPLLFSLQWSDYPRGMQVFLINSMIWDLSMSSLLFSIALYVSHYKRISPKVS
jgi:hypothetical protein